MMNARKKSAAKTDDEAATVKLVEAYLDRTPKEHQELLVEIRALVRGAAPKEVTEIFSYGMPGFEYKGRLLWYGAFKSHVGLYPGSPPMLQSLAQELKGFKTSKGAVQFPVGKPLPKALIKKIVKLRVAENEARSKAG